MSQGVLPGRERLLLPTAAQQYAVGTNRVDGIMQVMLLPRQQWEVTTTYTAASDNTNKEACMIINQSTACSNKKAETQVDI